MRMWMVPPSKMCDQHLLGEHIELHMLVGTLKREKSVAGYVANNLIEPLSIIDRHSALVDEMTARGMNHKSALEQPNLAYLPQEQRIATVDRVAAHQELVRRCPFCKRRAV